MELLAFTVSMVEVNDLLITIAEICLENIGLDFRLNKKLTIRRLTVLDHFIHNAVANDLLSTIRIIYIFEKRGRCIFIVYCIVLQACKRSSVSDQATALPAVRLFSCPANPCIHCTNFSDM